MSIMDTPLRMMNATAIGTSIAAAAKKGSAITLGTGYDAFGDAQTPDIGKSGQLYWNGICDTTDFASSGSPVVTATLVTSTDASGSSSAVTLATKTLDKTPNAGDILFSIPLPFGTVNAYVMTKIQIASAAMTAGKMTTWIGMDPIQEASDKK